jgi:hypothetical protein
LNNLEVKIANKKKEKEKERKKKAKSKGKWQIRTRTVTRLRLSLRSSGLCTMHYATMTMNMTTTQPLMIKK